MSTTIVENFILAVAISLLGTLLGTVAKVTGIANNITDVALAQVSASTANLTRGAAAAYGDGKTQRGDSIKVDAIPITQNYAFLVHFNDATLTGTDEYLCFGKLVQQGNAPQESSIKVNGKAVYKGTFTLDNNIIDAKPVLNTNRKGTGITGISVKNSEIYIPDEMFFYTYSIINKSKARDFLGIAIVESDEDY